MPQAVWRMHITMEDRVRSRDSLCEFRGGKSGTETIFFPDNWYILCQYHSTYLSHSSSSYYYSYQKVKQKKQCYIVFGLHKTNKIPHTQERPTLQLFFYFICQWLRIIASIKEILRSSGFTIPTAKSQRERGTKFGAHLGTWRSYIYIYTYILINFLRHKLCHEKLIRLLYFQHPAW